MLHVFNYNCLSLNTFREKRIKNCRIYWANSQPCPSSHPSAVSPLLGQTPDLSGQGTAGQGRTPQSLRGCTVEMAFLGAERRK